MSLLKYLDIDIDRHRVIAVVGGGGKTSLVFALAAAFLKLGKKTCVTTSTKMLKEERPGITQLGTPYPRNPKKIMALPEAIYKDLTREYDVVLVEADGAKMLPMKVPAEHEPVIPCDADMVIGILGASAIGKPLKDICFRHKLAEKILGVGKSHIVNFNDLALLLNSPYGQKKKVTMDYRMVIGQADLLDEYVLTDVYKYFTREGDYENYPNFISRRK